MDLQYYGANCLVLSNKDARLVIDDTLAALGLKSVAKAGDIAAFTGPHDIVHAAARLVIDGPGEYEVSNLSIVGIAAQAHTDDPGTKRATIYKIMTDDATYLSVGHINPDLNDDQLEAIGMIDVLFVPVGGNGYTLDAGGALQLIRKIEPKIVVPTHYADAAIRYPVVQQPLETVLKNLAMEPKDTTAKLRFKRADAADTTQLIVLTRS
ncbi:MAG TPA: MBL fold metallo-hydrolase [Candidatus Saccharimonadales bacterium]|nr:MBL fold metallo-hydrolase [Candidatus Saccharimonadales bacterium]